MREPHDALTIWYPAWQKWGVSKETFCLSLWLSDHESKGDQRTGISSQESHAERRKRLESGTSHRGIRSPRKRSNIADYLSAEEAAARTMLDRTASFPGLLNYAKLPYIKT